MVEIKNIKVNEFHFMGIQILLPGYPLFMITSTHSVLATHMFDISYFEKGERNVAVMLTSYCYGFKELQEAHVIAMNEIAQNKGVQIGMAGKEALYLCEKEEKE